MTAITLNIYDKNAQKHIHIYVVQMQNALLLYTHTEFILK